MQTRWPTLLLTVGLPVSLAMATEPAATRELGIEERVRAQDAIERVYWSHRIWPRENAGEKPALEAVLSSSAIHSKVEDYLRKSNALETRWGRPITSAQLQAEMDRMARASRQPEVLRELLAALGDDPFIAAECLARPLLVDRLIRSWYSKDGRFHGALEQKARAAAGLAPILSTPVPLGAVEAMKNAGGRYQEMTWRLERNAEDHAERSAGGGGPTVSDEVQFLDLEEWEALARRLTELDVRPAEVLALASDSFDSAEGPPTVHAGPTARPLPLGRFGAVKENDDSFSVTAVLARTSDSIRSATVSWDKVPFETWWAEERTMMPSALDAPAGPYTSIVPSGAPCTDDTWLPTMQSVPRPRTRHSAVWTGSEMIVWGGADFGGFEGDVKKSGGRYNPSTDTWSPTSAGAGVPSARWDHSAVWTGTEMIVWGGEASGFATNTGGRYDPASDSWISTSTGPNVPSKRYFHSALWTGSRMIVWGGDNSGSVMNSGGSYDPALDLWTTTSTAGAPTSRALHTAVWTGTEMIVWGGWPIQENSGGRYDPSSNSWSATSTGANTPTYRRGHSAVWTGTEMIVWGGEQFGINRTNTGARYSPATNTWNPTSTLPGVPDPRSFHKAVWTGTHLVVWGGQGSVGGFLNTGGWYDPLSDSWIPTSLAGQTPSPRAYHTAVWTGIEMIVWGGLGTSAVVDTGGVYRPTSDTWTPTSMVDVAAAARSRHSAVWTGSEMIVWGGSDASSILRTGGRYSPAADSWLPTATGASLPIGRRYHSSVWTGSEMIVWGGSTSSAISNSGDRYNPASDTWEATSTGPDVASARYYHTAIWTGSQMIVWGGQAPDGTYLDTGALYTPSTNSWLPTGPGLALPSPRSEHTAVWTGTDMVIWGGAGPGGYLNTGSRYRPSLNAWFGAGGGAIPSARKAHTAIWTGREMIVWGGYSGQSLNTGGRYDPASGTWSPTSAGANVPSPRYAHSAVWTGREMIVWGGAPPLVTGGRYDPLSNVWRPTRNPRDAASARELHTAVWTGSEMIVWGGQKPPSQLQSGGRYCADTGCEVVTWYGDGDGDGYGNGTDTVLSCMQPPGYVATTGDCDHANGSVWRSPEEVAGLATEKNVPTVGDLRLSWTSLDPDSGPGTSYRIVRGILSLLHSGGYPGGVACAGSAPDTPFVEAAGAGCATGAGDGCWYLVRGQNTCGLGTYGAAAVDAANPCP